MPVIAPLYPPPPYDYANAELYALGYPLTAAAVADLLPECLAVPKPDDNGDQMCALVLARYANSPFGAYDELSWLVPAQYGEERGYFCPAVYVTNDAAMAAGRELWGFPNKLATIEWTSVDGRQQVILSRSAKVLLSIRFECTEAYDVDRTNAEAPRMPVYNVRQVAAAGPGYVETTYLTATFLEQTDQERAVGLASVRMGSVEDEGLQLLAPADRRVPVVFTQTNITLSAVDIAHVVSA